MSRLIMKITSWNFKHKLSDDASLPKTLFTFLVPEVYFLAQVEAKWHPDCVQYEWLFQLYLFLKYNT